MADSTTPLRCVGVLLNLMVCVVLASAPSRAADFLSDAEIQRDVIGGDFAGHYADGRPWQEHYRADGGLSYSEAHRTVDGYWTLDNGVFCTLYWRALTGGCWRVKKIGTNCVEFYSSATTPREEPPAGTAPQWTARGWRKEKAPTCGAPPIS